MDRLFDSYFPAGQIGSEGRRERVASSALPPLFYLHVWWARRPLVTARAAVLLALLPDWTALKSPSRKRFRSRKEYEIFAARVIGLPGKHPKDLTDRAFLKNLSPEDRELLDGIFKAHYRKKPRVLDPMAGGGSIPFEAARLGCDAAANDLNPVAALTMQAAFGLPYLEPDAWLPAFDRYANLWQRAVGKRLKRYFLPDPEGPEGPVVGYIWAHTIPCPDTGKPVPLYPNAWLARGRRPTAFEFDPDVQKFRIVTGPEAAKAAARFTVRRGRVLNPYSGKLLPSGYVEKHSAGISMLPVAVAVKSAKYRRYRTVTDKDRAAITAAGRMLKKVRPEWEKYGVLPAEQFPATADDRRPLRFGLKTFADFFTPRQLLVHGVIVEEFQKLKAGMVLDLGRERGEGLARLMGLAVSKCVDRNSRMTRWVPQREVIANTFDRHDYSFKWTFAEFDGATRLLPWAVNQIRDAAAGIGGLARAGDRPPALPQVLCGNAAHLTAFQTGGVDLVCMDPPYGDKVLYGECADFFYVWQKRLGTMPDWFKGKLSDQLHEASANSTRDGSRAKTITAFTGRLMEILRESRRVLKKDGTLILFFAHRSPDYWQAAALALALAGFRPVSAVRVESEFEHSLHQRGGAESGNTILRCVRCPPPEDDLQFAGWLRLAKRIKVRGISRQPGGLFAGVASGS